MQVDLDCFFVPARLIASVPGALGYWPRRRLVLLMTVAPAPDEQPQRVQPLFVTWPLEVPSATALADARRLATNVNASAVAALIVDDRLASPDSAELGSAAHRELVDALVEGFDAGPPSLVAVWGISDIIAGAEWFTLCGSPERGLIGDPLHDPATRERTERGQEVQSSREAVVQSLAPDRQLIEQIRKHNASAGDPDSRVPGRRRSAAHNVSEHSARQSLRAALELLGCCQDERRLSAVQLACLAGLIADSSVRDCLFAVANTARAAVAEATWVMLVRGLTGPDRAHAAVLLAYFAAVRGDTVLASIAVGIALEAGPHYEIAVLLDAAIEIAIPPQKLLRLAHKSARIAAALGVEIPQSSA
ncbi:DUF4192 domain-containing protein [Nocardia cyriacigeorgica]|uniref:DUF4192 domain-containing protein n=1 Tax=Nocardia cyriacigeorgica TaxID=135487 RepID=UPI00189567B5|nr:DUF4192 domain-containing protein [Nocardia cyriacigeorgica]MBF6435189.1 DUF4192 domain-containing protein [Nocardia cyriacigeorgica]MBF6454745.1 DUF4192 domain-containing protein [Nocardia cyriacigeorgica]MBF6477169.1 DUF4192 domain-containing protein [Nocardia cyriacigeorgica]MBF6552639.1 DUF4192 domain-containing protein [Nocardia cyriacigeorgica]